MSSSWSRLKLIAAPTGGPVLALADAKAQVNAGGFTDDDALITNLIAAAQGAVEGPKGIGIALLTQTWQLTMDRWPREIELPIRPFQTVTGVTYLAQADGSQQTLDPSQYVVDGGSEPATITRAANVVWPPLWPVKGAIKIEFVCGFGPAPSAVPAPILHAMKLLVSHWYNHRDGVVGVDNRDSSTELPLGVSMLLDPYRAAVI